MKNRAMTVISALNILATANLLFFPLVLASLYEDAKGYVLFLYFTPQYWFGFVLPGAALLFLSAHFRRKNRTAFAMTLSILSLVAPYIIGYGLAGLL